MLERVKSVVLALLVISSLFLTAQQWTSSAVPSVSGVGGGLNEPSPMDILSPWVLFAHSSRGVELFGPGEQGYEQSWGLFRSLIAGSHVVSVRTSSPAEWDNLVSGGALEFRLAGRVQLRMWLEAQQIQPTTLTTDHYFNHFLLSPNSTGIYFRDTRTDTYLVWEAVATDTQIEQFMGQIAYLQGKVCRPLEEPFRSMAAPWVLVLDHPGMWPEIWARNERSNLQSMVNGFFSDLSLVRRVGERGGRTSFTDGRRMVYLYAYGGLEFVEPFQFRPLHEVHARASLLLEQGLTFVARHGGWPAESRIRSMSITSDAAIPYVDFEFVNYYRPPGNGGHGITSLVPLVSWRQEIGVRVTERNVAAYERFVYVPVRLGPPLSFEVISAERALAAATSHGLPEGQITDVYLGYYQREIQSEEFLYPVWVIEQGPRRTMINGYTAELVVGP